MSKGSLIRSVPTINLCPLALQRPAKDFHPTPGNIAIVVDESDRSLVALQIPAKDVPLIVEDYSRVFRHYRTVESMFWGALHSWMKGVRNPVAGLSESEAYARGLAGAFFMAFTDAPDAPGRGQMMRVSCDMQMQKYGAACITLGVLLQPMHGPSGTSPRTRRWVINHGEPPTYKDPRTALFSGGASVH